MADIVKNSRTFKKGEATVGGGKTYHTLQRLSKEDIDETIIFASMTKRLSVQTYKNYLKYCKQNGKLQANARLIDSDTFKSVSQEIKATLDRGYKGIIFITHSSYLSLLEDLMDLELRVIIDEVPEETLKFIDVKFDHNSMPDIFAEWLELEKCEHHKAMRVVLKDDYRGRANELVSNISSKKNTAYSNKVADVMKHLLCNDKDVLYYTNTSKDGKIFHKYQCISAGPLSNLVKCKHDITILGANVEDSPFGYIAKNVFDCDFVETMNLRKTHSCPVEIYPYLEEGSWSSTFKSSSVKDTLFDRYEDHSIMVDIQRFAMNIFGTDENNGMLNWIACKNKDDALLPALQGRTHVMCTHVHGINEYQNYNDAAFFASARPEPDELKAATLYSINNNLKDKDKLSALFIENRCHEACRQFFGRTSVRLPTSEHDNVVRRIVVPDMHYANYLLKSYPNAKIVTIHSFKRIRVNDEEKAESRKVEREATAIALFTAKKNKAKGVKVDAILVEFGVSRKTMANYKKEFSDVLKANGLI